MLSKGLCFTAQPFFAIIKNKFKLTLAYFLPIWAHA
jgi:hypothetical protein